MMNLRSNIHCYRNRPCRYGIRGAIPILAVWLFFSPGLQAQLPPDIQEVSPGFHQWVDSLSVPVTVGFKRDASQINDQNFLVYGSQMGRYPGSAPSDPAGRRATFRHKDPAQTG